MLITNISAIKKLHSLGCKSTSNKYVAVCKLRIEVNNTLWIPGDTESYLNNPFDKNYWDNYPMYTIDDAIECLLKNNVEILLTNQYIKLTKDSKCKIINIKEYTTLTNLLKYSIEDFINEIL